MTRPQRHQKGDRLMHSGIKPEEVAALIAYDAETGSLVWKPRSAALFMDDAQQSAVSRAKTWNARFAGTPALNSATCNGYLNGRIFGKAVYAHRAAYAIHTGAWPVGLIDHINGNRSDNRAENLRDVSDAENSQNSRRRSDNTSGVTGIYPTRSGGWQVRIGNSCGKTFRTKEEAIAARAAAMAEGGYHANHGRSA